MTFTAAIIAGGQSSRMGTDKAFATWRGTRLLDHQLATVRALVPSEILLSGRPAIDYGVRDLRVVFDASPDGGPLAGIAAVLAAARHDRVLVLAIDLPAITPAFLQRLLARCRPSVGAAPEGAHGWEPLAAVYPRDVLPRVQARLARGELGLQPLLDEAAAADLMQPIPVDDVSLFHNVNTPGDL